MPIITSILSLLVLYNNIVSAQYNYYGCYNRDTIQSLGLTSKGSYIYQSVSYCQEQCAGANIVALFNGGECYCGDTLDNINSLGPSADGSCTTPCDGWPYQNCGGSSYIDLYVNEEVSIPSKAVTTLSPSTSEKPSSTLSTHTTTSKTSIQKVVSSRPSSSSISEIKTPSPYQRTSTQDTSTDILSTSRSTLILKPALHSSTKQASSSVVLESTSIIESSSKTMSIASSSPSTEVITVTKTFSSSNQITTQRVSYITSIKYATNVVTRSVVSQVGGEEKTVYVTATSVQQITTATTTLGLSALNRGASTNHHKMSGGSIAGVVVGVVCGVILLIAIIVFFFWRRKRTTPDEYTEYKETIQHQPYSFGETEHNATVIPVIPTDMNWMSPKTKHTSGSFAGSSNTEFINSPTTPHLAKTVTNSSFIFEAPHYYDRDIFSASSLHNADEGMLHIVNPDGPNYHNDLNKNETNISTDEPDSSNTSKESDDPVEKF